MSTETGQTLGDRMSLELYSKSCFRVQRAYDWTFISFYSLQRARQSINGDSFKRLWNNNNNKKSERRLKEEGEQQMSQLTNDKNLCDSFLLVFLLLLFLIFIPFFYTHTCVCSFLKMCFSLSLCLSAEECVRCNEMN